MAVLTDLRAEIGRADQKAAVMLATAGVGVGALGGALLAGSWNPGKLPAGVAWLWWLGIVLCSMGIIGLAAAIYPRSVHAADRLRRRRSQFVGQYSETLMTSLEADSPHAQKAFLLEEIRRLSAIADAKYRGIRYGMLLLLGAIVCCLVVPVLAHIIL
ncbi:Pycsar system effector family protein [Nonomuraea guangzhouensis]|uniref:Pycsar system effector family protein n=1 Tax=Nonomuraea guangzhouensis TaxID=1291555 RepID=A0ABW4FZ80_9ACTN|nr:Pycsar system effector family protein [Nonomuraea guangzhouensis]